MEVFLPSPAPPKPSSPSLAGCVARLEVGDHDVGALKAAIPFKLADYFGGSANDFKVSSFSDSALAIFFPNWVARESAIGQSPLWLDGVSCNFSNWVEKGEVSRGHLQQKFGCGWLTGHYFVGAWRMLRLRLAASVSYGRWMTLALP